jgi:hypothetical protein
MRSGAAQLTERAPDSEFSDHISEICYVGTTTALCHLPSASSLFSFYNLIRAG